MPLLVHSARFPGSSRARPWLLALASSSAHPSSPLLFLFVTRLSFSTAFLLALLSSPPPITPPSFYSPRPASPWSRIFRCFEVCPFYLCRSLSSLLASSAYTPSSFLYTFVSCIGKLQVLGEQTRPLQQRSCAASTDWYRPHTPSATSRLAFFSNFPSMRYRANSRPAASPL